MPLFGLLSVLVMLTQLERRAIVLGVAMTAAGLLAAGLLARRAPPP
ncbi:MAG: hypothetical protein U0531_08450 [Dehalococcoidia bacterium]